ncbi:hypothetical protein [Helicobacter brantae]|uniref:Uncharacterized protein n=1 Tax=Helicobacter brantae TaxID=375927 RepID=A0A3D8IZ51_9HELI|nr:hypothetical protein [Helicobacter brantae]RDU70266.1 hypothetical protein CQA58_05955 [Helicobacter brantae]
MKRLVFSSLIASSYLFAIDMTLEELQQENQRLQLQIQNAQMKQQLQSMTQENTTTPPPPTSRKTR